MNKLNCLSLFCSGGLAETYLEDLGIDVVLANELITKRCDFYEHLYPKTELIRGNIEEKKIREEIISKSINKKVDIIMATPPCQGMSRHGKREKKDHRNQLINFAIDVIVQVKPKYVFIENVPRQLQTYITYNNHDILIPSFIKLVLEKDYKIYEDNIFNSADYGVPQNRKRCIFRMVRKDISCDWVSPKKDEKIITLRQAIGHLPSLDPLIRQVDKRGFFPHYEYKKKQALQVSIWHRPPIHSMHHIEWMTHTPSGKSAFENTKLYPKMKDGRKIKGRISCYKRFSWDKPANTLTQNNGVISSSICVHPGRKIFDEESEINPKYSDARVLSIYELLIVSSLPLDWNIPQWAEEKLIRSIIGEGIPPLLVKKIMQQICF